MNVFMIGGTGLLGCEAAKQLIAHGHKVTSVALPPLPEGAPIPEEMDILFGDINKKSDDEIRELLKGQDVFIFAAGVDERVEFPAPVSDYYYKFNIAPLERILPLCKEAGLKNAVVLGSYFAYLAKKMPERDFAARNPYFRARLQQEAVCEQFADDSFGVKILPAFRPDSCLRPKKAAGQGCLPCKPGCSRGHLRDSAKEVRYRRRNSRHLRRPPSHSPRRLRSRACLRHPTVRTGVR